MRKICVITGSRAEYGLMKRLMKIIKESPLTELQIIATNMHLMPEFGNTYTEIESDGFQIDEKVYMPKPSDNNSGIITSMTIEMQGINEALDRLKPDLIVLLGDRYEMLIAATVSFMKHIPIAHLHGGEISEGALDDSIRHAITKLSHLHFTSTEEYRKRVIQLGENPDNVFYVGALGVENIDKVEILSKNELEEYLNFKIDENTILATYHPVTLEYRTPQEEIGEFLSALDEFPNLRVIFTMPNSDQGGAVIKKSIENYCTKNLDRCRCFSSLGMLRYLSTLKYVAAVIGNSSSGLLEVPSAHIPTLNIGNRQKGRTHGTSVLDVAANKPSIVEGIKTILSFEFKELAQKASNPYKKENTAQNIFNVISKYPLTNINQKKFNDLSF